MEFWGVEVKAGEPLSVKPEDGLVIHLSQACLGETKAKGNDSAIIFVKVGDQKLVLGNLSSDKFPQMSLDLVFEKEFELSHNWKHGSIHFCGYQTFGGDDQDDEEFSAFGSEDEEISEDEEEEAVIPAKGPVQNGKVAPKAEKPKAEKPKVKVVEPIKTNDDDEDSDELGDDSDDEDDSDEDMLTGDDSEEDDDSDDESDEETPKKPESSKKRPNEAGATKTPVSAKKAKIASPKSDGKKVHTATPHPAKKGAKTPAPAPVTPATAGKSKSKAQTPKSGGSDISCKSCTKTFGSDKALESHNKAKHA